MSNNTIPMTLCESGKGTMTLANIVFYFTFILVVVGFF